MLVLLINTVTDCFLVGFNDHRDLPGGGSVGDVLEHEPELALESVVYVKSRDKIKKAAHRLRTVSFSVKLWNFPDELHLN